MTHVLKQECETYARLATPEWITANTGKFTVIHGDSLSGLYDTENEAVSDGVRRLGLVPMLVREVGKDMDPVFIPTVFAVSR